MPNLFRKGPKWGVSSILLALFLAACGSEAWEQDPEIRAVKAACKGLEEGHQYDCIERHAVESLNPDICRLAGIWIDDMCLQAVYEAADDPAICEQLYLKGVRPTCRAYYQRPPADWSVDAVLSVGGDPDHHTIAVQVVVSHQGNRPVEDPGVWLVLPPAEGLPAEVELTSTERAPAGPLEPNHARTFTAEIGWQTGLAKEEISAILNHVQIRLAWTLDGEHQEGVFPLSTGNVLPTLLVGAETQTGAPTWRHILFVYNHKGAAELWTVESTSGEAQRQIRPEQTIQDPTLSPSGEAIAYVRVTGDYGGIVSELWLMDRDGGNPRALYVPPAEQSLISRPAWSPSGQEVYFLQGGREVDSQLVRIQIAGGEPTAVLTGCRDFALSPVGHWLAHVSLGHHLSVSEMDGTHLRDIDPQGATVTDLDSLAISPGGTQLAFRGTEGGGEDTWNLYVLDWDGRAVRRLTNLREFHPFTSASGQVNGLSWTADGAHLVYSVDGHPDQLGVWWIRLDGGDPQRLFAWKEGEWAAIQGPWFD